MPSSLVTHDMGYPWTPDKCPADQDIIKYLDTKARGQYVFHMGPGIHHKVGLHAWEKNNHVTSVTCAREDMAAYMELVIQNPKLLRHYTLMFTDIQMMTRISALWYNYVFLPHLGEMPDERRDAQDYQADRIDQVLASFTRALSTGGEIWFYTRSSAWGNIKDLVHLTFPESSFKRLTFESLEGYTFRLGNLPPF